MSYAGERLPYPGLRSFSREETDLFFGREGCVDDMVNRLAATRFLAVLGASGSGKSSLVKTGMLDALELGFLSQAGPRWSMAIFAPGEAPMTNLARELLKTVDKNPDQRDIQLLRSFLARGPRSIVEWCSEGNLPEGKNLLILVDQFEELFRYSRYAEREEAEAFVALLLESARVPLSEARIYVAITMRSEYLGEAALIDGLADAINNGLYLTPRMTRDQVREAVTGPAAVEDFEIEPALVNRLLNDLTYFAPWEESDKDKDGSHQRERLGRRADQLPLMQHVLNRLWSIAAERGDRPITLTLKDYTDLGGLKGALGSHGRQILSTLTPKGRAVAGSVFRALVTGSSLSQAVRNPTRFHELVEIAGGDEEGVRDVVETFRAPGVNFLMPPPPAPLLDDTFIDISHESLIRQWDQFSEWLGQEIESSEAWWRLIDAAERYEQREGSLLSGLSLASLAHWWDTEQPTAAWARRHGGDYAKAKAFLEQSRAAEEAAKAEQAQEQRQKARGRIRALAAALLICIITPLTAFAGWQAWRASQQAEAAEQERENAVRAAAEADSQREAAAIQAELAQRAREQAELNRQQAETSRREAQDAQTVAETLAELAQQAQRDAEAQEQIAQQAREDAETQAEAARIAEDVALAAVRQNQLERVANRAESYQLNGLSESASGLLATFWRDLAGADGDLPQEFLIPEISAAFGRQTLAEYSVVPAFLNYSGLDGTAINAGRFRVYPTSRTTGGQTENAVSIRDVVTGGTVGSFALPAGTVLARHSGLLVTPDGSRLAALTEDDRFVLWSRGWDEPVLIEAPSWIAEQGEGTIVLDLAPVNSDRHFVIMLSKNDVPEEIIVIDPGTQAIVYEALMSGIAASLGADDVGAVDLIGTVGDRLILTANYANANGDVVAHLATMSLAPTKGKGQGSAAPFDLASVVSDPDVTIDAANDYTAQLTPDGQMLITITCSGYCYGDTIRHLVALDAQTNELLWSEELPPNMELSENAVRSRPAGGDAPFATLTDHRGFARIFSFGRTPESVTWQDPRQTPWLGVRTFNGQGVYVALEAQSSFSTTYSSNSIAEGYLASYIMPEVRQRLQTDDARQIYVDLHSVAMQQVGDAAWVAGVSYAGDLLVFKRTGDGEFALDRSFPSVAIGLSDCIAGIAFGGDGRSLLIRRKTDGAYRYISVDAGKNQMDWFKPAGGERGDQEMQPVSESGAETDCTKSIDGPNAEATMIAPADPAGRVFAVLDGRRDLWWLRIDDSGASSAAADAPSLVLDDLSLLRKGVAGVVGDPQRNRIAVLSPQSLEIISSSGSGRATRIQIRSEPRTAVFHGDGVLAVSFIGDRLQWFREANGAWTSEREVSAPSPVNMQLVASETRVAILDDRDSLVIVDRDGTSSAYTRLPADPIRIALLAGDRDLLSIEWTTDSAAIMALDAVPGLSLDTEMEGERISSSGRLVVMRSHADRVQDGNIDELARQRPGDAPVPDGATAEEDCGILVAAYLARIEYRILGDAAVALAGAAPTCMQSGSADRLLQAIEELAAHVEQSGTADVFADENFSLVLQAAAAGDPAARRVLGAALAQMATDRGAESAAEITADAIRFGTGFPPAFLREVAAGAGISDDIADAARQHVGYEPTALQLMAHMHEREINDLDSLGEALFEFAVAERLYRDSGRQTEADFSGQRRVELARILPQESVLAAWERLQAWQPSASAAQPIAEVEAVPEDAVERTRADIDHARALAEALPDSPLLASLLVELDRAHLRGVAATNPALAADELLQRGSGQTGWSAELVEDYLDLADAIGEGAAPGYAESQVRLAMEAIRAIGAAFPGSLHTDREAVDLFDRAATIFVGAAKVVPPDVVTRTSGDLDLAFAEYTYDTLPAVGSPDVPSAEDVLGAVGRITGALARSGVDATRWNRERGEALFWQGVLIADHDKPRAAEVLRASAEVLRQLVDSNPEDIALSYRYAEALRWQGAQMPSGTDRASVQRTAVSQYSSLWDDRAFLDSEMLDSVGTGYGWGLTNFGQTLREINIVDEYADGTVEDNADWMLEVLAVAAEEQDVMDTLAERGLYTPDTDFASGLNQMHTYGWALGYVSGVASYERGNDNVTQCDLKATDPYDAGRRAPATSLGSLSDEDLAAAEAICREERDANPDDARTTFELAVTMSYDEDRDDEFMPLAGEAAEAGVAVAYVLIGNTLYETDDDRSGEVYLAGAQAMIVESFPILYRELSPYADDDDDRAGLAWYAERAAAFGVPEAHVALAEAAADDETKRLHFLIAARLWDEAGDTASAGKVRRQGESIELGEDAAARVAAEVESWTPSIRAALPDGVA